MEEQEKDEKKEGKEKTKRKVSPAKEKTAVREGAAEGVLATGGTAAGKASAEQKSSAGGVHKSASTSQLTLLIPPQMGASPVLPKHIETNEIEQCKNRTKIYNIIL